MRFIPKFLHTLLMVSKKKIVIVSIICGIILIIGGVIFLQKGKNNDEKNKQNAQNSTNTTDNTSGPGPSSNSDNTNSSKPKPDPKPEPKPKPQEKKEKKQRSKEPEGNLMDEYFNSTENLNFDQFFAEGLSRPVFPEVDSKVKLTTVFKKRIKTFLKEVEKQIDRIFEQTMNSSEYLKKLFERKDPQYTDLLQPLPAKRMLEIVPSLIYLESKNQDFAYYKISEKVLLISKSQRIIQFFTDAIESSNPSHLRLIAKMLNMVFICQKTYILDTLLTNMIDAQIIEKMTDFLKKLRESAKDPSMSICAVQNFLQLDTLNQIFGFSGHCDSLKYKWKISQDMDFIIIDQNDLELPESGVCRVKNVNSSDQTPNLLYSMKDENELLNKEVFVGKIQLDRYLYNLFSIIICKDDGSFINLFSTNLNFPLKSDWQLIEDGKITTISYKEMQERMEDHIYERTFFLYELQ